MRGFVGVLEKFQRNKRFKLEVYDLKIEADPLPHPARWSKILCCFEYLAKKRKQEQTCAKSASEAWRIGIAER